MSIYYKSIYKELEEDFERELEELKKSQKQKEKQLVGIIDFQNKDYSYKFTKSLKDRIKKRDEKCQFPGCGAKNDLTVHHVDYNKKNCQEDSNLITLCRGHNSFVNKREEREYWHNYFKGLLHYKLSRKNETKKM